MFRALIFGIAAATAFAGVPMVVNGKVMLEDGSRPPIKVSVKFHCGSSPAFLEVRSDKKGEFVFQLGDSSFASRAFESYSNAQTRYCELTANAPGYQTAKAPVPMHGGLPTPDEIKIVLHALASEGKTVSLSDALAPAEAKEAFEKARQDPKHARAELMKAVEIYPKYAAAWYELGKLQMDASESAARQSFQKSLEADPKFLPAYDRLSVLALNEHQWQELADISARLLDNAGALEYPQAYYYNAQANLTLNHLDLAEKSARQALLQDPKRFVRANYLLGLVYARRGQFGPASEQLKVYLASAPPDADPIKKQLADFEMRAAK
ncbi:MAG TPA: hypothetical protein VGL53_13255 [Bryobacteraceae bacterium]|jgi:tetratricopeptide (TPR) repeat protein